MPKNTLEILKEWTLARIRHKDILKKEVTAIEQEKDGWNFVVHAASGDAYYAVSIVADFAKFTKMRSR